LKAYLNSPEFATLEISTADKAAILTVIASV